MRKYLSIIISLLLFASGVFAAVPQSGRNRPAQGAGKSPTPPADSTEAERPAEKDLGPEGETVEDDTIRVDTTLVTVPVSVRDRDGRYAPDLRREDFRIFEDGAEQRIAYFATVDQPFTVALVLDTSASTDLRLEDMQRAAIVFVRQLKEADRVLVVAFDDKIKVLAEPTNDREVLTAAIRRARSGGSTRLYDTVDFVIKKRFQKIAGRKAIVLFTDGVDTASSKTYEGTVRLAEELDALIYPVSYATLGSRIGISTPPTFPGGRGGVVINGPFPGGGGIGGGYPSRAEVELGDSYLHQLADKTGGRFYRGDSLSGIAQAFEWVADELRRQYSLGYYPSSAGKDGQRRQIKVRVKRPNLVVLSRESYIYTGRKNSGKEPDAQKPSAKDATRKQLVGAL